MKGFQACVGESVEAIGTSSAPSIFSSFGDLTGDTKGVKRVLSPGTPELFWDFGLLTRSWDFKPRICDTKGIPQTGLWQNVGAEVSRRF
ncbi:hypothetical protein EYR41_008720 [Orbilia oligospora]|uniref:Uncharacterized protein n=1 Tax=Orbilia oligospora TaxID=2813651 RepID=A0A8H2DTU9_ORBOL|nr:hypothetical protein EYR41_008720 [Orbilia oligospora]